MNERNAQRAAPSALITWLRGLAAGLLMCWASAGLAQPADFPSKPITIYSPYSPGGSDLAIRNYTNWITQRHPKWVFVIEFRPGAQSALAYGQVSKSPPDGYSLAQTSATLLLTEAMDPKPSYSLEQFSPVYRLYATPQVFMVHQSVPAKSMKELVAHAKANPGKLDWAMIGLTGIQRITAEFIQELLGVKFTFIPYKGTGSIGPAVISGEVAISMQSPRNTTTMIRTGKVRALAHTGPKGFRFPELPDVRNFAESGAPEFEHVAWTGLHAPAGTPLAIRTATNRLFNEPFGDPVFEKAFITGGDVPVKNTIEEFEKFMKGQQDRWVGTANRLGIKMTAD